MANVSVVIPVYNAEKYIAATVQSVLNQTYTDFELLIVDDGAIDRSIELCQQFADPRIKIIHQPNRGVSAARNAGIREAKGRYIAFLDGDDLWTADKLEKHVQHLESSPNVGVSFCRSAFIDEAGKPLDIYQMPQLKGITPAKILCRNPIGNGSAPVIRRDALEGIKYQSRRYGSLESAYFDEELHHMEDVECWLRISLKTPWQTEGLPEPLTQYRVNLKGASTNVAKQLASLDTMLAKTSTYAPKLVTRWGSLARAYELRFLSRRVVTLRDGKAAMKLCHQALATCPKILFDEPRRTLLTLAAAYSLCLLPQSFYRQLEMVALKMTGAAQKRRIQEQVKQA
ncbi:glycosyltransferase family 2 protein [Oculatella sp. LEGE 06141]|uniref:glycosyltransferase family 2 protein n=1 Tax=Oculatella sp. LEGE 06141 TaxID=1828648 RepID=UPI00187F5740|nr:glycosyltransferase family 2 protein [Oculatella sp. LEGE 06141]MBE9178913.1 glycosyltransferase family 2 protein [Oculatella sp. LEGE 06141]